MTLLPSAISPLEAPIPEGTWVSLDEEAVFIDRDLLAGGSPWRLLRLNSASRAIAERWQGGDTVRGGEERFARTLVQEGFLVAHFTSELSLDQVEVIVPVLNDAAVLRNLLGELRGFRVTVVDDGSADADVVARHAEEFGANLLHRDRQGPAAARNVGARASSAEFLWFIDADVALGDATAVAQRLLDAFADPLVAAVAPRVRGAGGPSRRDQFEVEFSPLDMGERSGLVVAKGALAYVPSACLMVRRGAYGDGFDETLRVGEDVDFEWRLSDQGWLVRYDAHAVVTHRARTSWRSWWRQRQRYGASTGELARRHGARLAPLRADRWTFLAWTSVLVGQPALGARVVRGARHHARERFFANEDSPDHAADQVVTRNMVRAGGPLARSTVRTFGVLVLLSALHPKLRARALALFAIGTAWRWRHHRVRASDVPLGIADDLAYGVGVFQGAWRTKSLRALTPDITKSDVSFATILGLHRIDAAQQVRLANATTKALARWKNVLSRRSFLS